jgi:hypothetical protein
VKISLLPRAPFSPTCSLADVDFEYISGRTPEAGLHYLAPRKQLRASFHNCCRSAMHAPAIVSDKMFSLGSLSLNSLSAATQYLCHYNKHKTSNDL